MFTSERCKFAYTMNTYGERLESAMQEAGFGGPGGQSQLAREIGARSQTINQAIKGGSKELSATFHVRACMRLGIRPLWLSEGRGPRYERGGPVAAIPGAPDPAQLGEVHRLFLLRDASQAGPAPAAVADHSTVYSDDQCERLLAKIRRRSPAFQSVIAQLVDLADSGQT